MPHDCHMMTAIFILVWTKTTQIHGVAASRFPSEEETETSMNSSPKGDDLLVLGSLTFWNLAVPLTRTFTVCHWTNCDVPSRPTDRSFRVSSSDYNVAMLNLTQPL